MASQSYIKDFSGESQMLIDSLKLGHTQAKHYLFRFLP